MSDTITLPRSLVEQIEKALLETIASNVAIQALCDNFVTDHETAGVLYAIESCMKRQEDPVCQAADDLKSAMEASHV